MYCTKCGKEIPEGSSYCMHCGSDLRECKVEISPKIEVSPKIAVSAEGGLALNWKKKPIKFIEIKEIGEVPVFRDLTSIEGKREIARSSLISPEFMARYFCPACGNFASLRVLEKKVNIGRCSKEDVWCCPWYDLVQCEACGQLSALEGVDKVSVSLEGYVYLDFRDIGKVPVYDVSAHDHQGYGQIHHVCPKCGTDELEETTLANLGGFGSPYHAHPPYQYQVYKLTNCPNCGFQLLFSTLLEKHDLQSEYEEVPIYPICEPCENNKAEFTCSVCGKRICENCAVIEVIKKGLFSKETITLCPDCAGMR